MTPRIDALPGGIVRVRCVVAGVSTEGDATKPRTSKSTPGPGSASGASTPASVAASGVAKPSLSDVALITGVGLIVGLLAVALRSPGAAKAVHRAAKAVIALLAKGK